jgi:hypothetical protein
MVQTANQTTLVGETHALTITTDADLSGKTLQVVFEGTGTTDEAKIDAADITVTTNSVTFDRPDLGAFPGRYIYAVRDIANGNEVLIKGTWTYSRVATADPEV